MVNVVILLSTSRPIISCAYQFTYSVQYTAMASNSCYGYLPTYMLWYEFTKLLQETSLYNYKLHIIILTTGELARRPASLLCRLTIARSSFPVSSSSMCFLEIRSPNSTLSLQPPHFQSLPKYTNEYSAVWLVLSQTFILLQASKCLIRLLYMSPAKI